MDEKWKLSKKEGRSSCSESRRVTVAEGGGPLLKGSASTKEGRRTTTPRSFSSRCASLVKEQRARFYIMRRCQNWRTALTRTRSSLWRRKSHEAKSRGAGPIRRGETMRTPPARARTHPPTSDAVASQVERMCGSLL
ncbi:hypothetical protein BHE74_00003476 [Ensete ventricosum]|nr:hypothetical protein BHE74_00003476 [Ensete ventricosum]